MTNRREFLRGTVASAAVVRKGRGAKHLPPPLKDELWYAQPATRWLSALPLGNGRLGAMIFGGVSRERIALSEATAWSGAPEEGAVNPRALSQLGAIRQLWFDGRYEEVTKACQHSLLGHAKNFGTNLPLPDLYLDFEGIRDPTGYRRSLNLEDATSTVSFEAEGTRHTREVFASHADQLLVHRLRCEGQQAMSLRIGFAASQLPCEIEVEGNSALVLKGQAFERKHSDGKSGVSFEIHVRVTSDGKISATEDSLSVQAANNVLVRVTIGTTYLGEDPSRRCKEILERTASQSYEQLYRRHVSDYRDLYQRCTLSLEVKDGNSAQKPTDERRRAVQNGESDPELFAQFFRYGRYLTISGSRHDSPLPLALQGIWNDGLASSMGWTDDFHLDINTQQNYWIAEVANLGDCQLPLFRLIQILRREGKKTARTMYGAPGWVVHTVTNPWGHTAPGEGSGWGLFVTAGIWISLQLWDHYLFGENKEFLRDTAYPILREAAEFFLAYLVLDPRRGWFVTGPSDSPENWFRTPQGGQAAESMGNTVDRVFVHALFTMCIEASEILTVDPEFRTKLGEALEKLPPFQIGRHGQLQEWIEDFEDAEPNHRHTSHLASLYPERQISPRSTPELAKAAEVTIQRRINAPNWEQTEWGRANFAAYYARLLKGDEAHKHLVDLLARATDDNLLTFSAAGVAGAEANIFAIDGNIGGAAAMAEMLLQSTADEIELLPALPSAWPNGSVRGLCARRGHTVDISWRDGRLSYAKIRSKSGGSISIRYQGSIQRTHFRQNQTIRFLPSSFSKSYPSSLAGVDHETVS